MLNGLEELRQAVTDFLNSHGLPAVTAWGENRRIRPGGALAAVSLRSMECRTPGFQDYLGERYNEALGRWEEIYGRKATFTFGVDVYGATAEIVREGANTLSFALSREGPAGLQPTELQVGETAYQESEQRYMCPAQVRFSAWLTAVAGEDGSFLDFEVKGEHKI